MAGRAQRIIWFLLLSPCCLPTLHFLISLKIVHSPLCFPCCYRHYRSFFVNYSTFQNSTTHTHALKKTTKPPPTSIKYLPQKQTHTHFSLHFSVQVRRMLQECGNNKKLSLTNRSTWTQEAVTMPTVRDVSSPFDGAKMMDDQVPPPLALGARSYVGWSMESGEKRKNKHTHTRKKV